MDCYRNISITPCCIYFSVLDVSVIWTQERQTLRHKIRIINFTGIFQKALRDKQKKKSFQKTMWNCGLELIVLML